MKKKTILLVILLTLMVSSCLVKSLHPFYKESDVIYDPSLVGYWLDNDSSLWTIEQLKVSSVGSERVVDSYKINYFEKKDEASEFEVHLFKLKGQTYVDFIPFDVNVPDMTAFHLVPTHSIAKIEMSRDSINLKWFNESWLAGLLENNKIRISHETIKGADDSYILTASTEELQKFIIKYGNDPNAFKDNSEDGKPDAEKDDIMCFTLKRVTE